MAVRRRRIGYSAAAIGTWAGLVAGLLSATFCRAEPLLGAPFVAFQVGLDPEFLTGADLNGDGKLDLVTSRRQDGTVQVSLGLGGGVFSPPRVYGLSQGGSTAVVADLTGDGKLDIAIADFPNTEVYILPGLGDGTFGTAIPVTTGFQCYTVAAADLDIDGHVDLIAASYTSIAVRMGLPGGGFGPVTTYSTFSNTFRVRTGYLNADPYPDVVASDDYSNVSVLLGNGDGSFQPAQKLNASGIVGLEVVDATGDGHDDVVIAGANGLTVYPGDGQGGFGPRIDVPVAGASGALRVGDLNQDSKPDVVMGESLGDRLTVLLGDGAGGFPNRIRTQTVSAQEGVWIGDADGDDHPDILVGGRAGLIAEHFGSGDGTFGFTGRYTTGAQPTAVALGDLDGDGRLDVIEANHASSSISVRRGNGDGTFGVRRDYETGTDAPLALAMGDVDGDGHADVAVASGPGFGLASTSSVSVFRGYAGGEFTSIARYAFGSSLSGIAIGDLDGDGAPDLVVSDAQANRLTTLRNLGNGSFGAPVHYGAGVAAAGAAIGDVNGDGLLDAVVANRVGGSVTILFGDGSGAFVSETELPADLGCQSVAIGRINPDTIADLVTANTDHGTLAVLLGRGAGQFDPAILIPTTLHPTSVAFASMNGDAFSDLVVGFGEDTTDPPYYVPSYANEVGVLLGTGTSGFQAPQFFGVADEPERIAVADLDGNGGPDAVIACRDADALVVLMHANSELAGVERGPATTALAVGRGYPNPSMAGVAISFTVPNETPGSLTIYDAAGRAVRRLVNGLLPAGEHLARWDRTTDARTLASPGIYFYELRAANRRASGRLVLL